MKINMIHIDIKEVNIVKKTTKTVAKIFMKINT